MKKKVIEINAKTGLKDNHNKRKNKKIALLIILGITIICGVISFFFVDDIKIALINLGVIKTGQGKANYFDIITGVKNNLYIYKGSHDDTSVLIYNEEELIAAQNDGSLDSYGGKEEIGKYKCHHDDCKGIVIYNNFTSIVIKDGDYYLYDYVKNSKEKLYIKSDYNFANAATYNSKIYGLFLSNYNEEAETYYSLSTKKSYKFDNVFNLYEKFGSYYIVDVDGYFLFDITNNSYTALPFSKDDYDNISPVLYKGKLYGYILHELNAKDSDDSYKFYSIKDDKITIENLNYQMEVGAEVLYNNIINDNKLYNISTGKLIYDFSNKFIGKDEIDGEESSYSVFAFGNGQNIYYLVNTSLFGSRSGYILDKSYNILFNGKEYDYSNLGVTTTGDLIISNANEDGESQTFSIYSKSGEKLSNSKAYKEVLGVYESYVAVIDNDNYLKLINSDGSIVAKFVKWTNEMIFHPMLSGYYEYKDIAGIYLVVQDNSIASGFEDEGYGYEYYYDIQNKEKGQIATFIGGYAKPVLYLYPTTKTNVTVTFEHSNLLTTTYPKYINNWQVTAYPNGDLYDKDNNYYYALYWEELKNHEIDFKEGFYVTKENAIKFLEEKLTAIGFNPKEKNEFIMYWLPILERNKKSLVYFELTEERNLYNKITINPNPDSLLRVAIHVKKVNKEANIKEQKLQTFERTGFTAVEWGGVEH
jgi:hypothetical protein